MPAALRRPSQGANLPKDHPASADESVGARGYLDGVNEIHLPPDQWDAAVADTDGPQLVVAGPGAGKTEFLVRRARYLIGSGVPPERILLLAFSRRGAADLKARVAAGMERSFSVIPASTFPSLAMRILEAHGPIGGGSATPNPLTRP